MFKDKTAWFSSSVDRRTQRFWVSEGGALSSWRSAEFLFSDDGSAEDTERIYDSEDYVKNRATVFHSDFLSTCEIRQSVKSLPIGHYVLPPVSIQNEMRRLFGKFIWEKDDQVLCEQQTTTEVSQESLFDDTEDRPVRDRRSQQDNQTTASPNNVCVCCGVQQYPVNNMITGYIHVDEMKTFSGELYDFLPSLDGRTVSRSND